MLTQLCCGLHFIWASLPVVPSNVLMKGRTIICICGACPQCTLSACSKYVVVCADLAIFISISLSFLFPKTSLNFLFPFLNSPVPQWVYRDVILFYVFLIFKLRTFIYCRAGLWVPATSDVSCLLSYCA